MRRGRARTEIPGTLDLELARMRPSPAFLAALAAVLPSALAAQSPAAQSSAAPSPAAPPAALPPERARWIAELERDVWHPFLRGVRSDSAPLYVGVHSRDFRWVAPGSRGRIMDRAEYDADSRLVMRRRRDEGGSSEIDVRFLERNVTESFAAEKVVTRFAVRRPGREPEVGYGIAHYFSRREGDGVWRVLLRYASPDRATEATFGAAVPLATPGAGREGGEGAGDGPDARLPDARLPGAQRSTGVTVFR